MSDNSTNNNSMNDKSTSYSNEGISNDVEKSFKIVTKSYYVIKVRNIITKKETYVKDGKLSGKVSTTADISEALRFEYFGLKGMEKALEIAMAYVSKIRNKGVGKFSKIIIVGGDIYSDINQIEDSETRANMVSWSIMISDHAIETMVNMSKDEDGEVTEDYVTLHKFMHHMKSLNINEMIKIARNWNTLSDEVKVQLAVGYVGEYSLSRFNIFMDYMSDIVNKKDIK